jgi:hypothetical protein
MYDIQHPAKLAEGEQRLVRTRDKRANITTISSHGTRICREKKCEYHCQNHKDHGRFRRDPQYADEVFEKFVYGEDGDFFLHENGTIGFECDGGGRHAHC